FDFVVAPGSNPDRIRLAFNGANKIRLAQDGAIVAQTPAGQVRWKKPLVYQVVDGERKPINGKYVLRDKKISFQIAAYDATKPLVIDPVLVYASYLGGSRADFGSGIAADSSGAAYVVGATTSLDFP